MPEEARWLDDAERRTWLGWGFSTRLLWEGFERDLQQQAGIPYGYYEILVMLSETPSRSRRMSELADATQSSRSRLSHAVARLEELGWVRREAGEGGRRRPRRCTARAPPVPSSTSSPPSSSNTSATSSRNCSSTCCRSPPRAAT